jgi:prophage antirepressor-like protein
MNEKIFEQMEVLKELLVCGKELCVFGTKDNPLFLAVEVARMIDYSNGNTDQMINCLDDDEKKLMVPYNLRDQRGGNKKPVWFITEFGLYEVLMHSNKPIAKTFRRAIKNILFALRQEHEQVTEESFYEVGSYYEQWLSWTHLRDDMGYPEVPFEEWIKRLPGVIDVEKEMRVYHEKINTRV